MPAPTWRPKSSSGYGGQLGPSGYLSCGFPAWVISPRAVSVRGSILEIAGPKILAGMGSTAITLSFRITCRSILSHRGLLLERWEESEQWLASKMGAFEGYDRLIEDSRHYVACHPSKPSCW